MASETVDPIDWSHPWVVLPERLLHRINLCSLSSTGNRSCNFRMRGNQLAYAATRGITFGFMVDNLSFFDYSSPFCVLLIEFHRTYVY